MSGASNAPPGSAGGARGRYRRDVGDAGVEQELGGVLHRFAGYDGFGHDRSPVVVLSVGARARAWSWCSRAVEQCQRPGLSTADGSDPPDQPPTGRAHRRGGGAPGMADRSWALRVAAQRPEWSRTLTSRVREMNSSVRPSERGELPRSRLCLPRGPGYTYDCGTVPLGASWRTCDRCCRYRLVTLATRTKVERQIP